MSRLARRPFLPFSEMACGQTVLRRMRRYQTSCQKGAREKENRVTKLTHINLAGPMLTRASGLTQRDWPTPLSAINGTGAFLLKNTRGNF
jgi:hypothetical protein